MYAIIAKFLTACRLGRLHRPVAMLYIILPCWWGVFWARESGQEILPLSLLSAILTVAAMIMRTAGCIYNDILDRNIDRWVRRTKDRPLVTGEMRPWQAVILCCILFLLALATLRMFSHLIRIICLVGGVLVLLYPLAKRVMKIPQLILGFTFNLGVIIGYVAVADSVGISVILLYIAGIYWTMIYDTIYAYQDRKDDIKIGINSTAVLYGSRGKQKMQVFTVMMTLCLLAAGVMSYDTVGSLFYFIALCVPLSTWQIIAKLDLSDMASCARCFKQCTISGFVILLAILVSKVYV